MARLFDYRHHKTLGHLLRLGAIVLAGLGIMMHPWPARAQAGLGDLWQTYTAGDGLRSGNISAVLAAADGTMWFATDAGASYFDGHQWRGLGMAEGLPSDQVRDVAQTKDGTFWIAMKSSGLARSVPNAKCCQVWTAAKGLPSDDVRALLPAIAAPDGKGAPGIWVGTAQGLVYLDGVRILRDSPLTDATILAMTAGRDGAILVSTSGRGIWERAGDGQWRALEGADTLGDVEALLVETDGRIWAGTPNGLFYYTSGHWQRFLLEGREVGPAIFAVTADRNGGLWLGTDLGLFYNADPRSDKSVAVQYRAQRNGLVSDYVRAMAFGPDGALWLGTIAGISRYAGPIWQLITANDMASQRINTVLTDSSGRTWVGTEGNGLAVWSGKRWQHIAENEGIPDTRIVSLFQDHAGRLWVGTGTDIGYLGTDGRWRFFGHQAGQPAGLPAGLSGLPVYAFEEDKDGNLWLGNEGGASWWNEATGFHDVPELTGKRVNAIRRDADGALWFALPDDGIRRRQTQQGGGRAIWTTVAPSEGNPLKGVVVNGIAAAQGGSLWVGTGNDGLWRYTGGLWRRMDSTLPSPKVLAVSYARGNLWVGTYAGLSRFDGETWQSYTGSVLPNPKVFAIEAGTGGEVWIGTETGLVHYVPEAVAPWIRVISVNLLAPDRNSVLLADGRLQAVSLDAGALGTRFDDLIFLLQVKGVDRAERISVDPFVPYGDLILTPGSHVLRVRVRDADFNYSTPSEITLVVPRPKAVVFLPGGNGVPADIFYPGLILGVLALGGLAAAGVVGLQSRHHERRRTAELEVRQREALGRHFNPYVCGEPIRQPDLFFGRDTLLHKIFNALHQNSIMIHGERRMGKTTLLYQLAEHLRETDDPEWVFIPVLVDLEGTSQQLFFHFLMEMITTVVGGYLEETPPALRFSDRPTAEYTDRDFTADLKLLLDRLKTVVAPRNVRLILLLDEMDVVNNYDTLVQQQLRRVFMSSLAENIGAVVAGVQISKAWDRMESPWYNMFNEVCLDPFSREDAAELLTKPVRGTYTWKPDALEFVITHADGRPFRLQQYGLEAVNHMLTEGRVRITLVDAQTAHQIIERTRTA